jgi:hypothetical protein
MHIILIILVILVVMIVFNNLNQQGVLRWWQGPNNNLGCIPLLLVFLATLWLITKIPVMH